MNNRAIMGILILITLLVFAAGCETKPVETLEGAGNPAIDESPEEEPSVPAPTEVKLSQEIKSILAKNEDITKYQYVYQNSDTAKYTAKYYVDGSKVKIQYSSLQEYEDFTYMDIYLDKAEMKAYLICEDEGYCQERRGKEVSFNEFNIETPLEAAAYIDNGEKIGEANVGGMATYLINYINRDGDSERVWIWTYRGLPVKREITRNGVKTTLSYNQMVVDPIEEMSVEPPTDIEMM